MMDRRIKKTKQALNQALFTLLDEKTFQQITITDIVTVADVNRGTFYKHYRDKEELLDSIIDEVLADLQKAYQDPYTHKTPFSIQTLTPSMIKIFDHVYGHQAFYTQVIKSTIRPSFQNQVCDVIRELILNDFDYSADSSSIEPLVTCILSSTCDFRHDCFLGRRKFCSFTGVYVRATSSYYSD